MSIHLNGRVIASSTSGVTAHLDVTTGIWTVDWLRDRTGNVERARQLTAELALAAVALPELVSAGVLRQGHIGWPLLRDLAQALNLSPANALHKLKERS
jgi:hypothetical protein